MSADLVDDFLIIEDLDVIDETQIRKVIAEVEALASAEKTGLRVSVLTSEQWQTVVQRMLPKSVRRGAELYIHMLSDPRQPLHLLISPSAVKGINEGSRHMYQEVVYSSLRALPTGLTRPLRHGVDDLLAAEVSRRIGVPIYTRNYPRESELVNSLMLTLSQQFGYDPLDWTVVFRRSPERVFKALAKSKLQLGPELKSALTAEPIDFSNPEMEGIN